MRSVLFVCTANVCRSPMAMGLLRAKVAALGEAADWRIESAGNWAEPGQPAAINTRLIVAERGVDLTSHRSRLVTRELLKEFNLVLTMEDGQKEALRTEFRENARRVFLLSEMIGKSYDIVDPVGKPIEEYRWTAHEIRVILNDGYERIRTLAARSRTSGSLNRPYR
jgi:protein arginine phosphatase